MQHARRTFVASGMAALLAAAGVTAAVAADPAPTGPPEIAFLANGRVPADALAAGPIAAQLGAPIYTTEQATLSPEAANALGDGDHELVVVLGGPVAIADAVVDQVEDATGLTETSEPTPAGGIVRAAGENRFATATEVASLLSAYDPAFLPVGAQSVDADTLDGEDASAFLGTDDVAADSDLFDGRDSTDFASSDQACASGDVVTGVGSGGTVVCASDSVDGGDAETVDGIDGTQLQLPDQLPSGRSVRGVYEISHRGGDSTSSGFYTSSHSFPIALPSGPTPHFIGNGDTPPAECPGTPQEPEAAPGHLCVYEYVGSSYEDADISSPPTNSVGVTSPYGFAIGLSEDTASSLVYSRGGWAATAP